MQVWYDNAHGNLFTKPYRLVQALLGCTRYARFDAVKETAKHIWIRITLVAAHLQNRIGSLRDNTCALVYCGESSLG